MFAQPYQQPYGAAPMQPFPNPYLDRLNQLQQPQMQQPERYDIIQVNGENGARAFRMAPNSRCLLLDETAPIVWLAQTDGAGYPTLTPYSITPYKAEQQTETQNIEARLNKLEAIIYGGKPNVANAEQTAQQPAGVPAAAE